MGHRTKLFSVYGDKIDSTVQYEINKVVTFNSKRIDISTQLLFYAYSVTYYSGVVFGPLLANSRSSILIKSENEIVFIVLHNGHIGACNVRFTKYVESHYTADKFCIVTTTISV
jgi:hypothetical protein